MKIGLYLQNKNVPNADLSKPEEGNPGVGGTQFNFVAFPYYFTKEFSNKEIQFVIYANYTQFLPKNIQSYPVNNCTEALIKSSEDNCNIFIFRIDGYVDLDEMLIRINDLKMKTIIWAHNDLNVDALNKIEVCNYIKRIVCVGQEQLDRIRDHPVFYKSTCIFNGFDSSNYIPSETCSKQKNTVVYLGNLIPAKGFHHLARIWPTLKKEKQDIKLIVIGSGTLYNENAKLGKWGIAEENYEANYIRPYLSNEDGLPDSSVYFAGLLGKEKISILQQAKVGVVNPYGATEICPGSAIEIQAAGTPVVSGAYKGLLDTVVHRKTGLLGKTDNDLIENILYLLNNPQVADKYGKNGIEFVKEKFAYSKICHQWLQVFEDINNNRSNPVNIVSQNWFYNRKYAKELLRIIKLKVPFCRDIPPLIYFNNSFKQLAKYIYDQKIKTQIRSIYK